MFVLPWIIRTLIMFDGEPGYNRLYQCEKTLVSLLVCYGLAGCVLQVWLVGDGFSVNK